MIGVEPPNVSSNDGVCAWIGPDRALVNSQGIISEISFATSTKTTLKSSIVRVTFFIKLQSHVFVAGFLDQTCMQAVIEVNRTGKTCNSFHHLFPGPRTSVSRRGRNI